VGDYTLRLGLALRDFGLDPHVLTGPAPQVADQGPLPRHDVSTWGWGLQREVLPLLRELGPDVLHIEYQTGAYRMHPAINTLPAALGSLRPRLPVVVTCHDLRLPYLFPKADLLRRWVTWRLLHDADAVVVTNGEDEARLRGLLPGDREQFAARKALDPLVIPIGSNIEVLPLDTGRCAEWRTRVGVGADQPLLAYFGLSNRSKGIDLLLQALGLLDSSYHLALIGGEAGAGDPDNRRYADELLALEQELGLQGRVWRSGTLPAETISELLQTADLAVLPFRDGASYRRGSLLAVLAHGLPLITTQPGTPLDPPLRDGQEALLLPLDETLPQQIAAAVRRLMRDQALRTTLSQGARALAERFGWPDIARRHLALYATLTQRR
jgi:glycosyltransferase involved in cell wall biosynthesis